MNITEIYQDINLLDVEDGIYWGLSGEAGISFELFPKVDLTTCEKSVHNSFVTNFTRILGCIPDLGGALFEVDFFGGAPISTGVVEGTHPLLKEIAKEKEDFYSNSGRTARYFFHLWAGNKNPLKLKLVPSVKIKSPRDLKSVVERNKSIVHEKKGSIPSFLSACGIKSRLLNDREIQERYWQILCPSKSRNSEFPEILPDYSLRSQLASCNASEEKQAFLQDGVYHSAVSFYTFPDTLSLGCLDTLLSYLPPDSRYFFSVLAPNQEDFLATLKVARKRTIAAGAESKQKDYEGQARESDLDTIITRCRNEGERIYMTNAGIILRSQSLDQNVQWGKQLNDGVATIFHSVQAVTEDCIHRRIFLSSLPMSAHLNPRRNLMMSSTATALAPVSRAWQGCTGGGLVLTSAAKEPICFDIYDNNVARHGIIIGTPGGGKSFFGNNLAMSFMRDPKTRIMVIDVGESFRPLTELFEGTFVNVRLDENSAVNPILPRSCLLNGDGKTFDANSLAAQTLLIQKIVNMDSGPAQFVIQKAIEKAFMEKEEPLLSDVMKVLKKDEWDEHLRPQARAIVNELLPYTEGVYSVLLSRPTRIRPFEKQITTFEMGDIKGNDALMNIMVSVISFSVNKQLEDRSIRKVVLVDEAHNFFKDKLTAAFIDKSYREFRKHNAVMIAMSQSPHDFVKSPCADAMMVASHWILVTSMKNDHEILSRFGFSDQSVAMSRSMRVVEGAYSELLIKFGDNPQRIARLAPTSMEYWTATTNPKEVTDRKTLIQEKGLSLEEAIRKMAKEHPVKEW